MRYQYYLYCLMCIIMGDVIFSSDDLIQWVRSSFRTCITRPIWSRKARSVIYNLERVYICFATNTQ
ncbi:hypothetical protein [Lonomia obliqua multiple nucleopolyhedrovirus]|uniref:Ig-like domain-containing protein n=1 Tax=Lonomia obliqua multiple nucleopolyhedrovirus TaxID=134394 RepID=A0A126FC63_9ABAC|nr:hypothetical protein [Lonomia obliqua multiple nucleopolyhedrovirus]AKN80974.1 hypothetical protein [Lonomia obliqua multiple nucleopolyhedrovirus]